MVRKSKGRQRVEMVKMQNHSNLQVTFSKRRAGLFKKASELCTLCGVDVALVVFSPGKKVFSFGHPSLEVVVEKFIGHDNQPPPANETGGVVPPTEQFIEAHRNARVLELSMELEHMEAKMDELKKKGEAIDNFVKANRESHGWIRCSYDELNLQQLVALKNGMEYLMKDVSQKAHQIIMSQGNGFPLLSPFGNMAAGGSTSTAPNFGTSGGGGAVGGAGTLPFSDSDVVVPAFSINVYNMPSGYNVFTTRDASTSGSSGSGANI